MSLEDEKVETLNRLKREKDIISLLKEYHFLPDTPEGDISPFLRTHAFNLIKDCLDQIEHAWKNFELSLKEYAIEFLKELNNRESLLILTKCLLKEDINDIQLQIIAVLKGSEQLDEIKDFFYESIESISGRKFELLSDVVSCFEEPPILKTILLKLKNKCPTGHPSCAEDVIPENSVFIGHCFSRKKKDKMRPHINNAILVFDKECKPYYADLDMPGGDFFCKICRKIQSARFGIYDLSRDCKNIFIKILFKKHCQPNPNVMLELGMSLAFGKKTIIIMECGEELPSDLIRTETIFYRDYKDLEEQLKVKIPQVLKRN
ncbi:MAG: hypothetical protein FJ264_00150 [Planctomycetes bacterium]|nr:hypothetical protein [Planctomycetota bacterium]